MKRRVYLLLGLPLVVALVATLTIVSRSVEGDYDSQLIVEGQQVRFTAGAVLMQDSPGGVFTPIGRYRSVAGGIEMEMATSAAPLRLRLQPSLLGLSALPPDKLAGLEDDYLFTRRSLRPLVGLRNACLNQWQKWFP